MTIYGIGIDVIEIERIGHSIDQFGDRFLDRVFTSSERAYCDRMNEPARHYAARFAAKEAVSKALGTGFGEHCSWRDIEVLRDELGKPSVKLTGLAEKYAAREGITEIRISLSHARDYAAANAVACTA